MPVYLKRVSYHLGEYVLVHVVDIDIHAVFRFKAWLVCQLMGVRLHPDAPKFRLRPYGCDAGTLSCDHLQYKHPQVVEQTAALNYVVRPVRSQGIQGRFDMAQVRDHLWYLWYTTS